MAPSGRLMVIFSLGGLTLQRRLRGGSVRCRPSVVALGGPPRVTLDPFPDRAGQGIVEDGWARLVDGDGAEISRRRLDDEGPRGRRGLNAAAGRRWDDLDLLGYASTTLWAWLVLPLVLDDPAVAVRERDGDRREVELPAGWPGGGPGRRHVLHLDDEGRVVRHDEGNVVHLMGGHCDFGGVDVATTRRTRLARRNVTVAWGDVVAAHMLPAEQPGEKPLN